MRNRFLTSRPGFLSIYFQCLAHVKSLYQISGYMLCILYSAALFFSSFLLFTIHAFCCCNYCNLLLIVMFVNCMNLENQ